MKSYLVIPLLLLALTASTTKQFKFYKPLSALLLLFLLKASFAQQITQQTVEFPYYNVMWIDRILKVSEGNLFIAGRSDWGGSLGITNITPSGEVIWHKDYGDYDAVKRILPTPDGGYFLFVRGYLFNSNYGTYRLLKLDADADLIWEKEYGGSEADIPVDIVKWDDDKYLLIGYSKSNDGDVNNHIGNEDIWMVVINSDGEIQSQKTIGGTGRDFCYDVAVNPDGGIVFSGKTNSLDGDVVGYEGDGEERAWVVKLNNELNIEWQYIHNQNIKSSFYRLTIDAYGSIVTFGPTQMDSNLNNDIPIVLKLTGTGEFEWLKSDVYSSQGARIWHYGKIISTEDNGYVLAVSARIDQLQSYEQFLITKIDQGGELEWHYNYGTQWSDWVLDMFENGRNSYVIVGTFESSPDFYTGAYTRMCVNGTDHITISDSTYTYSTELIAPSGYHSYHWNTGDTTQSITITEGGAYSVGVSSGFTCGEQLVIDAPGPQMPQHNFQPCLVTVDEQTNKNLLVYQPIQGIGVDSVLIYKYNEGLNIYRNIATLPVDNEGLFLDEESFPDQKSESYKIALKDTAGIISDKSLPQSTVYLEGFIGVSNNVQLSWSDYEGFDFANFKVYRSVDESDFELIAILSNQNYQYTDVAPPEGEKKYKIVVDKENPCQVGDSSYSSSSSNTILLNPMSINSIEYLMDINVYPNPFNSSLNVEFHKTHPNLEIEILDTYGRVVASKKVDKNEMETSFSIREKAMGMYFVRVNGVVIEKVIKSN